MALQQPITNEKGATTTYHRIVKANLDFTTKEAVLTIFSYVAESLRQAEKDDLAKMAEYNEAVTRLDKLVANPTEENEQERVELSEQINSLIPATEVASLHLNEVEYKLPLDESFSIQNAYSWLKENVFTDATDV